MNVNMAIMLTMGKVAKGHNLREGISLFFISKKKKKIVSEKSHILQINLKTMIISNF